MEASKRHKLQQQKKAGSRQPGTGQLTSKSQLNRNLKEVAPTFRHLRVLINAFPRAACVQQLAQSLQQASVICSATACCGQLQPAGTASPTRITTACPSPSLHPIMATHLELVAQCSQCRLELGDGGIIQLLLPVEAGAAVVGQQLAGVLLVDGLGKGSRLLKAGLASLQQGSRGQAAAGQQ
jgi:hypothetical protein